MVPDDWLAYTAWAGLCATGLLLTLWGIRRTSLTLEVGGKLIAASAYLGAAASVGALDSRYGRFLLTGMACCWLGDLLLVSSRNRSPFIAGLSAFLAGHVVYSTAFLVRGVSDSAVLIAAPGMAVFAALVIRWLQPHLDARLRFPVYLYVAAISLMMVLATATFGALGGWALMLGAALFVISDLAVARHRFVKPAFVNRAWGLPVYFTAQMLLAASAG